jgi:hypothetical protein
MKRLHWFLERHGWLQIQDGPIERAVWKFWALYWLGQAALFAYLWATR